MVENQLYWTKSQLWLTYSQTSSFFINIKILRSHSSFDQGFIMIHQENSRIDQKSKVAKLGFLKWKSTELWPSITFTYFIKKNSITAHFKGNSIIYNFMSYKLGLEMLHLEVIDRNIIGPFKKSTKSHLFAKKCSWAWKLQWRWKQKGCLEDILSFLKSPRTPRNVKNWAGYKLCKLSIFEEVHKKNI